MSDNMPHENPVTPDEEMLVLAYAADRAGTLRLSEAIKEAERGIARIKSAAVSARDPGDVGVLACRGQVRGRQPGPLYRVPERNALAHYEGCAMSDEKRESPAPAGGNSGDSLNYPPRWGDAPTLLEEALGDECKITKTLQPLPAGDAGVRARQHPSFAPIWRALRANLDLGFMDTLVLTTQVVHALHGQDGARNE